MTEKQTKYVANLIVENTNQEKEIERLNNIIDKAITIINIYIQVIEQQPSANIGNDDWILDRFKSIKSILQGDDKE